MPARNDTARELLEELTKREFMTAACSGYFGSRSYCLGIRVRHIVHVFELGAALGFRFGSVRYDRPTGVLVFEDALVSA